MWKLLATFVPALVYLTVSACSDPGSESTGDGDRQNAREGLPSGKGVDGPECDAIRRDDIVVSCVGTYTNLKCVDYLVPEKEANCEVGGLVIYGAPCIEEDLAVGACVRPDGLGYDIYRMHKDEPNPAGRATTASQLCARDDGHFCNLL